MRVLHAIHDFLPRHRAGSEIYALHLAQELQRRGHRVTVLCAEYDTHRDHGSVTWRFHEEVAVAEVVNNWIFDRFEDSYRPADLGRSLAHVLKAVGPHVLHLHSLLNLSFDLPSLAADQGIATVATLHDFTLVCPSGGQRVHQAERHLCQEIDRDRCARCFTESHFHSQMVFGNKMLRRQGGGMAAIAAKQVRGRWPRLADKLAGLLKHAGTSGLGGHEMDSRLEAFRKTACDVHRWVAPSRSLADDFQRFGMPADRLEISDYGFPPLASAKKVEGDGRLRIGFIGTLVWHKGIHVLLEAAARLPPDRFVVHVFGDTGTFPSYVESLRQLAKGLPIVFEGAFESNQVAEVYARIDVLVVSSLWPENSPLVIHEAAQAGVPVVGSRMGGTVDLLGGGELGLLYDAHSPVELAQCLERLIDEASLLEELRKALPVVKSLHQDASEWEQRYEDALRSRPAT